MLGALAGQGKLDDTLLLSFKEDRGARSRGRYAPDEMIVYRGANEIVRVAIRPTVEVDPRTGETYPWKEVA